MKRIYWIFVLALVLVGCSQTLATPPSDDAMVTRAPTDTLKPSPIQSLTQLATLVPTVTTNATLQAAQTQNAVYNATQGVKYTQTAQARGTSSSTPTFVPRPTNTSTLTPTLTFTPDPNATVTPTPDPAFQVIISPDGKYVAKLYDGYIYPTGKETIEIQDTKGAILWKIPYQGEVPTGDPRPYLYIYQWSKNSAYLYFYYAFGYDGVHTLWDGYDLQVMDVKTGYFQNVIYANGLTAFRFSPDERYLAYTRADDSPRRFFIRDMKNGTERSVVAHPASENFVQVGWIAWSPDGQNIVYHTMEDDWVQVFDLNVATMQTKMVFEYWVESYWFNGWSADGKSLEFISYEQEIIAINIDSGEQITIGTPTPTNRNSLSGMGNPLRTGWESHIHPSNPFYPRSIPPCLTHHRFVPHKAHLNRFHLE